MGEYNLFQEKTRTGFTSVSKKKKNVKKFPARDISAFQLEFISVQGKDKFEAYCRVCMYKYICKWNSVQARI